MCGKNQGKIVAVCRSKKKGTAKIPVDQAYLKEDWGLEDDAHAGHWHRQVSLLSKEAIDDFKKRGADVSYGDFGENLVVEGLPDLTTLPVGTRFQIGDSVLLELTQIGKSCHSHCAIYERMGECIMPKMGVFAVVKQGGAVRPGDTIRVIPADPERAFTAAVITLSDRASAGVYEDRSGPEIGRILTENGYEVVETILLPDGKEKLKAELCRLADQRQVRVVFTTGGTGFSDRDVTPEATKEVCEREVPGIGEALRSYSMQFTKHAMLSRQTAGIRKHTLVVILPGCPKACREDLEFLLPSLSHGLGILGGTESD